MNDPVYPRYQRLKKADGKKPSPSVERVRQDALSNREGWLDQPKDFDWLAKSIPCQAACPAGTDIPGYLDAIAQGRYDEAYLINLRDNVFPAVLGRVCTRPCEPACRHGWEGLGEPVAICFSKRSAADFRANREPVVLKPVFPASGKKVAVIGAGAAGLSAARELALLGHDVTVYEQHDEPGGMMVQGIPAFRLPRDLVRREIEQVRLTGVNFKCGVSIGRDVMLDDLAAQADAVIIAAGTMKPMLPGLPGEDLTGVMAGLDFLRLANAGGTPPVGRRVVVIGGGFTAVDCARMAQRLGAEEVRLCYRRTAQDLTIHAAELEAMREEGILVEGQVLPVALAGADGCVSTLRMVRTQPGEVDADGRRGFVPVAGSEFEIAADTVLLATGQRRDEHWSALLLDAATRPSPIFAAGDVLTGAGSLIEAVAGGRKCAREVDRFLTGAERVRELGWVENVATTGRTRAMDTIPRQPMPTLPVAERSRAAEVETGFGDGAARTEARRCYLCSYKFEIDNDLCIYCDRCLKVKPVEGCIVKVARLHHDVEGRITGFDRSTGSKDYNLLYIDSSQCIRCGACREVCPVECISLQQVTRRTVCMP